MFTKFKTPTELSVDGELPVARYQKISTNEAFKMESLARRLNADPKCPFVFMTNTRGRHVVEFTVTAKPRPCPPDAIPQDFKKSLDVRTFESYFDKTTPSGTPTPSDPGSETMDAEKALFAHLENCGTCIVGDANVRPDDPGKLCELGRKLYAAAYRDI